MADTVEQLEIKRSPAIKAGTLFDWASMITFWWIVVGAALDNVAHFNGMVDDSFFTPWHGVLYSGFLAAALVHMGSVALNLSRGYPLREAIPQGYDLALIGCGIFAVGAVGDMLWHTAFGIESDIETLLSPTHMILFFSLLMILTGPLRSIWMRNPTATSVPWLRAFPAVMSLAATLGIVSAYMSYLSPFGSAWASNIYATAIATEIPKVLFWPLSEFAIAMGISSIIFTSALFVSVIFLVNTHLKLPLGSWTLILLMAILVVSAALKETRFLVVALVGGIFVDLVANRVLKVGQWQSNYYLWGTLIPVVIFATYFIVLMLSGGIWWPVHVWGGAIFLAATIGAIMLWLIRPRYQMLQR
jgi:hypothetical protein